ncbi:MAG: class I SAM-dependent methyltransferase [Flavobacteriales bacterium]|nr:class I SAM-dependent methyltransferase [Flavobacteriales bacterium]MCB9449524.1 class I SAM-dependent methyltransferase [Flavobacteriales bacterium]
MSHIDFLIQLCNNCDLGITSPRPPIADLGKFYESEAYISHSNTNKGIISKLYHLVREVAVKQKCRLVEKYSPHGKLLDIGCGTGQFLSACKDRGWQVMGLEPNEKARAYAKEVLRVPVEDISELPKLPIGDFQAITMWHVLEHIPDLNHHLDTIHTLLADDGTLFIAVPNKNAADAKYYGSHWAAYDVPRHLWHFSPHAMNLLLNKHGFALSHILPMLFDSYYVSLLSEKYKGSSQLTQLITGFLNGWRSNRHGKKDGNYSSLIYIAKKLKQ